MKKKEEEGRKGSKEGGKLKLGHSRLERKNPCEKDLIRTERIRRWRLILLEVVFDRCHRPSSFHDLHLLLLSYLPQPTPSPPRLSSSMPVARISMYHQEYLFKKCHPISDKRFRSQVRSFLKVNFQKLLTPSFNSNNS